MCNVYSPADFSESVLILIYDPDYDNITISDGRGTSWDGGRDSIDALENDLIITTCCSTSGMTVLLSVLFLKRTFRTSSPRLTKKVRLRTRIPATIPLCFLMPGCLLRWMAED